MTHSCQRRILVHDGTVSAEVTHCRDCWHVEGYGWARGTGLCPIWGRRKLQMQRSNVRRSFYDHFLTVIFAILYEVKTRLT